MTVNVAPPMRSRYVATTASEGDPVFTTMMAHFNPMADKIPELEAAVRKFGETLTPLSVEEEFHLEVMEGVRVRGKIDRIDRPETGHYRSRLRSGGPWVPAIIWSEPAYDPVTMATMDRAPVLRCVVDGEERDPHEVWTRLHPITYVEYLRFVRDGADIDPGLDIHQHPVRI